jgi:hypothetical protein
MKQKTLLAGLIIAGAIPTYAEVNFIEQIDLASGLIYHVYVDGPAEGESKSGKQLSPMPSGEAGSTYHLYSTGLAPDNTVYLLDEKYVAAYTPSSIISITSEDPHPTPRTRADEPFTVDIKVDGLLEKTPETPKAALNVYIKQLSINYDPKLDRALAGGSDDELLTDDFFIVENAEIQRTGMTKLTSDTYFKERGEEVFRAYALPDSNLDWLQIASEKIQVWPIADVAISGITHGQKITRNLPNITIDLTDLYPESSTKVQIYKGAQALGTTGTIIDGSVVTFNSIVPQDSQIFVRNWDSYGTDDGIYTLEVITTTPFDNRAPERLAWVTFEVDRTIEFHGSITSSDSSDSSDFPTSPSDSSSPMTLQFSSEIGIENNDHRP